MHECDEGYDYSILNEQYHLLDGGVYDNPDITMTVVVPNGYTSANAAEIARDIYKYYFGKASKAEKKATTALLPTGSDGSND